MLQRIEKHNCIKMCNEETCDNEPKYYDQVEYNGLKVFIQLCEKHYLIAKGMSEPQAVAFMQKHDIIDDLVRINRHPVTQHQNHADDFAGS